MLENKIYLAGGCFWGMEEYFKKLPGVLSTEVGYANGYSEQTNYYVIHSTNHAETLKITYDSHTIHLAEILERFYKIIDPTSINRQGADVGTQYRTGIFYKDENSKKIALLSLEILQKNYEEKIAILLQPLKNYVRAEEFHQNYLEKNPDGYCHIDTGIIMDALYKGKYNLTDEEIKEKYGDKSYEIVKNKATEPPFSSEYDKNFEEGIYVDIVTGKPLFASIDKYDAHCGWPSFAKAITTDVLKYNEDNSHNMQRTEVVSEDSDCHLGHIFDDGPEEKGGYRYCINGKSIKFIPKSEMKSKGYEKLLPYLIK